MCISEQEQHQNDAPHSSSNNIVHNNIIIIIFFFVYSELHAPFPSPLHALDDPGISNINKRAAMVKMMRLSTTQSQHNLQCNHNRNN
jgi:hypothetical protein